MTSKELLQKTLNHQEPEKIVFDMGASAVTGIHVLAMERLRDYYGLEKKLVRVIEPYQMLGLVEDDMIEALGIDVVGAWGEENMFGNNNLPPLKMYKTLWGQEVLVPEMFNPIADKNGNLLSYPASDTTVSPSAMMPKNGYFFDAIERQQPIIEDELEPQNNLEEFVPISSESLRYWKEETDKLQVSGKGILASLGGTALGDIALIPAMQLKHPKGIRSVAEWYMSTLIRTDYVSQVFDEQSNIAVENLQKIYDVIGNNIDVVNICGTDFGTQDSTFCSPEQFDELWLPYYQRINSWIHSHTNWKTFKHSCGAVENFMERFIDAGFDIINPVQLGAKGMDPKHLKNTYGKHLTFWGGGVDTQKTLSFATPKQVEEEVLRNCEIFAKDGGFVFNTVHNIQANVPTENIVAMINALRKFNR